MRKKQKIRIKTKHFVFFILLAFAIYTGYDHFMRKNHEKSLLIHRKHTTGIIIDYYKAGKGGGGSLFYHFEINGKRYEGLEGDYSIWRNGVQELFVGKKFPVVYDSTNPDYNHIIVDPADFRKYKLRFPDSLNWIRPYFNE